MLKEETYKLIGLCMKVHRKLGLGFLEAVYKDALEYEFTKWDIPFDRELEFEIIYDGAVLPHRYIADFVLYDSIILEIKASKDGLSKAHKAQIINYLKVSGCQVGLLTNFGRESLEFERLVF